LGESEVWDLPHRKLNASETQPATQLGFRKGETGELVPVPEQQTAIRKMIALRDQRLSFRLISEQIAAEAGFKLSHVGVRGVLATAKRRIAA